VTLLAFVADRRAAAAPLLLGAGRAVIDRYLRPARLTAANPPHAAVAVDFWDRQTDGRTDGRTPYRCIDPAAYNNTPKTFDDCPSYPREHTWNALLSLFA